MAPGKKKAGSSAKPESSLRFSQKLVLNQWLLGLLGVADFGVLTKLLLDAPEGLDANQEHHFHGLLVASVPLSAELPAELLLDYEQRIVTHTCGLNEMRQARGQKPIVWKYFQWLALLFTEVYLDWYFRKPAALLAAINKSIDAYNDNAPAAERLAKFDPAREPKWQLNKVVLWMATGSGKTLLMHANIRQFQFYLQRSGNQRDINRTILLTPNERLSEQHLEEFVASGMPAEIFEKDSGKLFAGQTVEIIEVQKLVEDGKKKTVSVEAFEDNNLLLVDEGHRGAASGKGGTWMLNRRALCVRGFTFEYSATFPQAIKGNAELTEDYARATMLDYSYRRFHADGFGKDFQIHNIDPNGQDVYLRRYMTVCLLSFYQQLRFFADHRAELAKFRIAKPLWVFVGNSVAASTGKDELTDIAQVIQFLQRYLRDTATTIADIDSLMRNGLPSSGGGDLCQGLFDYLHVLQQPAAALYQDTLVRLFHAPAGGHLYVENLEGAPGEIALKVNNDNLTSFGLINVADDAKLTELLAKNGIDVGSRKISSSMFASVKSNDSEVHLLIGSRKFAEGWSSWRVSTLGLLNMAASEGAQAIQLFGRGVRLQGWEECLKRTSSDTVKRQNLRPPKFIELVETLGVFGIKADYMESFRKFLEEDEIQVQQTREFYIPMRPTNQGWQDKSLYVPGLPEHIDGTWTANGEAFRKLAPVPVLDPEEHAAASERFVANKVALDWYPRVESLRGAAATSAVNSAKLSAEHLAFVDFDKVWFELEDFKARSGWYNLNLPRQVLPDLIADHSWYELLIPEEELEFGTYANVRVWQQVVTALLRNYIEKFYRLRRDAWEKPYRTYRKVGTKDANLSHNLDEDGQAHYRVTVDSKEVALIAALQQLESHVREGHLKDWSSQGLRALYFDRHLYAPLLAADKEAKVKVVPAPLNTGESKFVTDLRLYFDQHQQFFADKELFVLRNLSKGNGVGFFEAGNFYPDFILWLNVGPVQHVVFVDPKGIRQMGWDHPKFLFGAKIRDIERDLKDPNTKLHSFIVPNTPKADMELLWGKRPRQAYLDRHILFTDDSEESYVQAMLRLVLTPAAP